MGEHEGGQAKKHLHITNIINNLPPSDSLRFNNDEINKSISKGEQSTQNHLSKSLPPNQTHSKKTAPYQVGEQEGGHLKT